MRSLSRISFGILVGLLALFTLASAERPSGKTVYVARDGSDSNAGTLTRPFRTIKFGLRQLSAGDTLNIRGGSYNEYIGNGDTPDGTPGKVITIRAYEGEMVTIAPVNAFSTATVSLKSVDYTVWKDLILDNAGLRNDSSCQDVLVLVSSSHNRFENVEAKNSKCNSIQVAQSSNYNEFINCNSHDFGQSFPPGHPLYNLRDDHGIYINQNSHDTLVEGGQYHDGFGWGIHVYNSGLGGLDRTIVRGVKAYRNGYKGGIQNNITASSGILVSDGAHILVYNNVVYGNLGSGIHAFGSGPDESIQIYNNTVYNNGNYDGQSGINIDKEKRNTVVMNNIVYRNGKGIIDNGFSSIVRNNVTTNPLFRNSGAGDFTLQAGSPAIRAGMDLGSLFTTDIAGNGRRSGSRFDVGAYSYKNDE